MAQQEPTQTSETALTVQPSFAEKGTLTRQEPFQLTLSRALKPPKEARIAVILGSTDISGLMQPQDELTLAYIPVPSTSLPQGQQEMVVYLCTDQKEWLEIGKFPVRVLGQLDFEQTTVDPSLTLTSNGQIAESHAPEDNAPERATFQDPAINAGWNIDLQRRDLQIQHSAAWIGAGRQEQALRFGTEGEEAPQFDLASYQFAATKGPNKAELGHLSITGGSRHLLNTLNSRGVSFHTKVASKLELGVTTLNGSNIVGVDNLFGLSNQEHRISAATVGIELLAQPGALRLESAFVDAKFLALDSFNQGSVNDPEENQAVGLRILGNGFSQRLTWDASWTRSRFTNPPDPFLSQGQDLVETEAETKNAQYLDLNFNAIQNKPIGTNRSFNLTLAFHHEKVDPLFRSLVGDNGGNPSTSQVRADLLSNQIDVQADAAGISLQASHSRQEDNLDEISSILKTLTRRNFLALSMPLGTVLHPTGDAPPWLPNLSYSLDRTHQFGDKAPVNGEFDEDSEVPDQMSTAHQASADWSIKSTTLRYAYSRSLQDNRQPERDLSDFLNTTHGLTLGLAPISNVNLSLEGALERAENQELNEIQNTRRLALQGSWLASSQLNFTAQASHTRTKDDAGNNESKFLQINATGSLSLALFKSIQSQFSLSLNHFKNESLDRVFGVQSETETTTINTTLSLSFF